MDSFMLPGTVNTKGRRLVAYLPSSDTSSDVNIPTVITQERHTPDAEEHVHTGSATQVLAQMRRAARGVRRGR